MRENRPNSPTRDHRPWHAALVKSRRIAVTIPEPVLDALYAEGSRTYETVGQVAARVLREALPGHVERSLRRDLAPVVRARVVDVRSVPADDPPNAATPPGLPSGATSESSLPNVAERDDTARRPMKGAGGGAAR